MLMRSPRRSRNSMIARLIYFIFGWLYQIGRFTLQEFRQFFSVPKSELSKNFWLTTRYHINSMGLWCAVGIAVLHLIYYIVVLSSPENLPGLDIKIDEEGGLTALRNFNYRTAHLLRAYGFHLIGAALFTLFLIFWLYIHYAYGNLSKRMSLLFCIIYIIGSNVESLSSLSTSFADLWLIMTPIIIIPTVGNYRSLPLLLMNLLLHHLFVSYQPGPYDILTSVATLFIAVFIMMMQMEYYRREVCLHESASRLRERALEIELIKENMDSGLMLLDLDLKIRSNYNDMCIKLLHKSNLRGKYFPQLLRDIVEENQYFINSMNYSADPEGDEYKLGELNEWEERVKHYFEMLKAEQLDDDELASIDPLKYIKIYSYEGRSYVSFHVSSIKVHERIQYFMVLLSNDTGKVAGRYRILEHERKHLESAQLLFALSHGSPTKQLEMLENFAHSYLELCKSVLTEARATIPPKQLIEKVCQHLVIMKNIFCELNLANYGEHAEGLLKKCHDFLQIELEDTSNAIIIINKLTQTRYIELIVDCERFLHELRSLFSIATFFIREPRLAEELQALKQALHYGLSRDTLQTQPIVNFYDTQLSQECQMFINLYTAFEMLLSQHDLQQDLKRVEERFARQQSINSHAVSQAQMQSEAIDK